MLQESAPFDGAFLEGITAFSLASPETGAAYRVTVSVPPGAGGDERRFPLLLVLDGCMAFGTAVETARVQAMTGTTKPLIVVGVSTDASLAAHNLRRLRDFTPAGMPVDYAPWTQSAIGQILTAMFNKLGMPFDKAIGGATLFQNFLTHDLLPLLCQRYPIDTADLGLAGHSAGGLFAAHALLTGAPFQKYLMGSFSLELFGETLSGLESAFTARPPGQVRQVYAAVGGAELAEPLVSAGMRGGQDLLRRLSQASPAALQAQLHTFPDETHGAVFAHLLSGGIRALWPSGQTYMEALTGRMGG